jgi:hypothetical protein
MNTEKIWDFGGIFGKRAETCMKVVKVSIGEIFLSGTDCISGILDPESITLFSLGVIQSQDRVVSMGFLGFLLC